MLGSDISINPDTVEFARIGTAYCKIFKFTNRYAQAKDTVNLS